MHSCSAAGWLAGWPGWLAQVLDYLTLVTRADTLRLPGSCAGFPIRATCPGRSLLEARFGYSVLLMLPLGSNWLRRHLDLIKLCGRCTLRFPPELASPRFGALSTHLGLCKLSSHHKKTPTRGRGLLSPSGVPMNPRQRNRLFVFHTSALSIPKLGSRKKSSNLRSRSLGRPRSAFAFAGVGRQGPSSRALPRTW